MSKVYIFVIMTVFSWNILAQDVTTTPTDNHIVVITKNGKTIVSVRLFNVRYDFDNNVIKQNGINFFPQLSQAIKNSTGIYSHHMFILLLMIYYMIILISFWKSERLVTTSSGRLVYMMILPLIIGLIGLSYVLTKRSDNSFMIQKIIDCKNHSSDLNFTYHNANSSLSLDSIKAMIGDSSIAIYHNGIVSSPELDQINPRYGNFILRSCFSSFEDGELYFGEDYLAGIMNSKDMDIHMSEDERYADIFTVFVIPKISEYLEKELTFHPNPLPKKTLGGLWRPLDADDTNSIYFFGFLFLYMGMSFMFSYWWFGDPIIGIKIALSHFGTLVAVHAVLVYLSRSDTSKIVQNGAAVKYFRLVLVFHVIALAAYTVYSTI